VFSDTINGVCTYRIHDAANTPMASFVDGVARPLTGASAEQGSGVSRGFINVAAGATQQIKARVTVSTGTFSSWANQARFIARQIQ
jgi:hypothetical protein